MTLKKNDARTREIAIMGNKARCKLHIHTSGEFKKGDPETRRIAKMGMEARLKKCPNLQSESGKQSRLHENAVASRLQGDFIFKPNEVCDRIVVQDGKVFFVEIKQVGQKLRPKQQLFSDIVKNMYRIVYA